MNFRWPVPLRAGDTVFVTAPSSGVPAALHARLDRALETLRAHGLQVQEGRCLRSDHHSVSATAAERAAEWQGALLNDQVHAVMAPWGGELAIELLPHLDFARLRTAQPKWVSGYSDLSTLALPLSLCAGWVTLHGPNLMELGGEVLDDTTAGLLQAMFLEQPSNWLQRSSPSHRRHAGADWAQAPSASLQTDSLTQWRMQRKGMPLVAEGRLMGGCLETVSRLAGTAYAPWAELVGPTFLYLEVAEASPFEVARTLHSLAMHGWFKGLGALLIGRSSAPVQVTVEGFTGWSALDSLLADFRGPVVFDVDIGHCPPQFTLANGAWARLEMDGLGGGNLTQYWGIGNPKGAQ